MTAAEALRDALARVVTAQERIAEGSIYEAEQVLADLEYDIAAVLDRVER